MECEWNANGMLMECEWNVNVAMTSLQDPLAPVMEMGQGMYLPPTA